MGLYAKILVAIDLSPEAVPVLKKVAALAEQNQAAVAVVHIANSPSSAYSQWAIHETPIGEGEVRRGLEPKLQALLDEAGLGSERCEVRFGRPAEQVLEAAEAAGAELLVIGRHSRRGVRALLGSTASSIINRANCDVMALQFSL